MEGPLCLGSADGMRYRYYHPKPPLDQFVEFIWMIEGAQADRRERIFPSGSSELVINLREDEIRIYNSAGPEECRRLSGSVMSGAYSGVFVCDATQHQSMLGIHFLPGGASPFLGIPAAELANSHANLDDIWGSSWDRSLRARLREAATTRRLFELVENALMKRIHRTAARHPAIELALYRFGPAGTGGSSRDIARELGMSQRSFIQLFTTHVGLTPKLLCRTLRFQHARTLAEAAVRRSFGWTEHQPARPGINWANIAAVCGYYDQSHFIHDFENFSGVTPAEYMIRFQLARNLKDNHLPLAPA